MKKAVFLTMLLVLVCGAVHAGLISHYEFQGDLTNSIEFAGDGTGVGGAEAVCPDPNDTTYPFTYQTVCKADVTGNKWIHLGYPGILYNMVTSQKMSIAMWINSNNEDYAQLIGQRYEWRMYIQEGKPALGLLDSDSDAFAFVGTQVVTDGNWHHVVATYDGVTREAKIYVDAQLDVSTIQTDPMVEISSSNRTAIAGIAGSSTSASSIFEGYMDDIRIYDHILDSSEIQSIYQFTTDPFCINPPAVDYTGDCKVTMDDLVIFFEGWLASGLIE
jgi:hypothetical protein